MKPIAVVCLILLLISLAGAQNTTSRSENQYDLLSSKLESFISIVTEQENRIKQLENELKLSSSELQRLREFDTLEAKVSQQESILALLKAPFPKSCEEIRLNDESKDSGMYWIDPDGHATGDPAIYVYCNMSTGSTSISHDHEDLTNVTRCREAGCFTQAITYNATMRQMMTLIQQSSHCRQLIEYECFSAPFEFNGVQYSWWNDRHGHPQYFWSGSTGHDHMCHCDTQGQCFDPSVKCNCDSIAPTELKDSGYITNKSLLPITRVNFGRLLTALSSGHYRLGRLECTGFVAFEGMPGSCEDLKRIGHQFSGFYTVKANNKVQTIYCDMSKLPGDKGLETVIGSSRPTPVYFYAQKTSSYGAQGPIPFEIAVVNIGDALNLRTGVFTAPVSGVYFFSFDAYSDSGESRVHLQKNGVNVGQSFDYDYNYRSQQLHLASILQLDAGDEIQVYLQSGQIYDDGNSHFTHFTGMLLNDDF